MTNFLALGRPVCGAFLLIVLGASAAQAVPVPILEYAFNSTGSSASSTGSSSEPLTLASGASQSSPGFGVGGDLVGHALYNLDRSFNNNSSTGMGSSGTGGIATQPDNSNIDSLMSLTVSGWFKTQSAAVDNFARIFAHGAGSTGFSLITGDAPGVLRMTVNGTSLESSDYGDVNQWTYFAASYDGAAINLYKGYRNEAEAGANPMGVTLMASLPATLGTIADYTGNSLVGNVAALNRPFDGFLDNLRIHGSKTDATGALSLADLETMRAADVFVNSTPTGGLVAYEPFNYAPGTLAGNDGGTGFDGAWTAHASQAAIVSGSLTHPDLPSQGNKLHLDSSSLTAVTSVRDLSPSTLSALPDEGTIYVSYMIEHLNGSRFTGLSLFLDGQEALFFGRGSNFSQWRANTGSAADGSGAMNSGFSVAGNNPVLLVIRIDRIAGNFNDIVRIFVNPTSGDPEPFNAPWMTGFDIDFNQIAVRAGVSGSASAESFLDEIRIGTNWDSVTTFAIVPEPSTHALMALGGILLLGAQRLRRRRK